MIVYWIDRHRDTHEASSNFFFLIGLSVVSLFLAPLLIYL